MASEGRAALSAQADRSFDGVSASRAARGGRGVRLCCVIENSRASDNKISGTSLTLLHSRTLRIDAGALARCRAWSAYAKRQRKTATHQRAGMGGRNSESLSKIKLGKAIIAKRWSVG